MNYQKMSKTALLKRCNQFDEYIMAIQHAENIQNFFGVVEIRNQRQLGIAQTLEIVRQFSSIFDYHGYWKHSNRGIPTRKEIFENAKVLKKHLYILWEKQLII